MESGVVKVDIPANSTTPVKVTFKTPFNNPPIVSLVFGSSTSFCSEMSVVSETEATMAFFEIGGRNYTDTYIRWYAIGI